MDKKTFEGAVLQNEDALYRVSTAILHNEHDAQDAVHDAILSAFENLHKLRQEEYFRTWLIRILINCCKKQLRCRSRYQDSTEMLPDIPSRDTPYLSLEIEEAISALPHRIRMTVILFYADDYSIKEISDILRIPEGTVKSRLNKGRKLLREQLSETQGIL